VDPLHSGSFVDAPEPPASPQAIVDLRDGLVAPFGLFPLGAMGSLVICRCVRKKPSYYCVRCLEPKELANLWDIPLLKFNLSSLLTAFLGMLDLKLGARNSYTIEEQNSDVIEI